MSEKPLLTVNESSCFCLLDVSSHDFVCGKQPIRTGGGVYRNRAEMSNL